MEQQQPLSWSHLPDVCLLLIFKKLPVSDMIRSVGRVCTNWGKVQRVDLRSRNTLVIATVRPRDNFKEVIEKVRQYDNPFGSALIEHVRRENGLPWAQLRPIDQIEFNTLLVPDELTEAFTSLVMDTLPNITHLTLVMYVPFDLKMSSLHQLTSLISHYTTSLVSLKLELKSDNIINIYDFGTLVPLFNSINRLESLRHLRHNIANYVDSYPELSILSRLATFSSDLYYPPQSLLASMRQYATGDDLRIEFGFEMELDELIKLDPQLAIKFSRLNHVTVKLNQLPDDIERFCQRFVSLHTLGLHIWGMPMTVLARCLSQLLELIHLKLRFVIIPWEEEELENEEENEEHIAQPEFSQVASVRLLTLSIRTASHHDTERLHLHQIFPNLQVLHLRHETDRCDECHFNMADFAMEPNIQSELQTQIVQCMHLARRPFRQCTNLHTLKLDSNEEALRRMLPQGLITWDQL